MYVTIVYVSVQPDYIESFKEACRLNHEGSVQESGNVRFDVLQSTDDPTKFLLYEAYKTQQDAVSHKETRHYSTWRETVSEWMVEPRRGVAYHGLYPVVNN